MERLDVIQEVAYLSTVNTPQYRRIMRSFYQEYEKMRYQLTKEEVLERLHACPGYEDYSMDQLQQDLSMLVNWKNLIPIQDPKRVYTIEEYKNKQYRYSMSENAVEIERMTIRLENLRTEGGSLSSSFVVRIENALRGMQTMSTKSVKEIHDWWDELQTNFQRLNQSYKDYLREFYSGKAERILKSVEFVLHKDRFIVYLQDFIRELQTNAIHIEGYLAQLASETEQEILERVIQGEMEVPYPLAEEGEDREQRIRESVQGKWDAIRQWFCSSGKSQSEYSKVLDITDEVIRKIIQNAALIVQMQNWGISRKEDYRKFISLFLDCEDIGEAHKLAAHVFGIQHVRHFKGNQFRSTDSINSSTYEEEPMVFSLKPRTRAYRPRIDRTGIENKSLQKQRQRQEYLEKAERDRQLVMRYIRGNRLDLAQIQDTVPVYVRQTLLRWIASAHLQSTHRARTEFGQEYHLLRNPGTCILHCEDGDMTLPAYTLEFMELETKEEWMRQERS